MCRVSTLNFKTLTFFRQGRQYDSDGNLVNWWSQHDEKTFKEKANCIIYQYGNFTVPEVDMNVSS